MRVAFFFADFRSIKQRRIGGTYTFDIMLEVKSFMEDGLSYPCVDVSADAYLVGIVRHVYDRGFTGVMTKVPEPENDHTLNRVFVEEVKNINLWNFAIEPFGYPIKSPDVFSVAVVTNDDAALFVIRNAATNEVLESGSGKLAKIVIPSPSDDLDAYVEFLAITRYEGENEHQLEAEPSERFSIPAFKTAGITVVGNYKPK